VTVSTRTSNVSTNKSIVWRPMRLRSGFYTEYYGAELEARNNDHWSAISDHYEAQAEGRENTLEEAKARALVVAEAMMRPLSANPSDTKKEAE
jgi:hypothetical protein